MMQPWSQLPNAALIDWVLQSMKDNPKLWDAAWGAAWGAAWDAAWDAALDAARDAARKADRYVAWNAARIAVRTLIVVAARDATWIAARDAAWCALAALVAYDDCNEYLAMTYEQLHAWAILSESPQAILLLPMKWVQEHEHNTTVAEFA